MEVTPGELRNVAAISEVPEEQLRWLIANSGLENVAEGDFIFSRGDPMDTLFILLEGEVNIKIQQDGNFRSVARIYKYGISGALPYSRASSAIGYGEAVSACRLLTVHKDKFREMVRDHFDLTEALVHIMTSRTREFARKDVQQEKMMALGKLSAGLSHELNNPASAIARSSLELKKHLANVPEKFKRIISIKASPHQVDLITDVLFDKISNRPENKMGLLERNEKEEELETWLEARGVDNAYEWTEVLMDFCMDAPALEEIYRANTEENFPTVIEWIVNVLTTEKMVDEIQTSAEKISDLVSSVKSYTHMDNAPERIKADISQGIAGTLKMLNHKLKQKGITVERDFQDNLPEPRIMVSEINQVWTNLIDNAIDAMDQNGRLTIRLYAEHGFIKAEIIDSGAGIPEEKMNFIFDPFYTTKAIGQGTGMGLEVVQRIVNQHKGEIKVSSAKGETNFTICLPLD